MVPISVSRTIAIDDNIMVMMRMIRASTPGTMK